MSVELFVTLGKGRNYRFDSTRFLRRVGWLVTPEVGSELNPIVDDASFHGPYVVGKYYMIRTFSHDIALALCFRRWTIRCKFDIRTWWKPGILVRFPWTKLRYRTHDGLVKHVRLGKYEFYAFGISAVRNEPEKPFRMSNASADAWNAEVDEPCWPMLVADDVG